MMMMDDSENELSEPLQDFNEETLKKILTERVFQIKFLIF